MLIIPTWRNKLWWTIFPPQKSLIFDKHIMLLELIWTLFESSPLPCWTTQEQRAGPCQSRPTITIHAVPWCLCKWGLQIPWKSSCIQLYAPRCLSTDILVYAQYQVCNINLGLHLPPHSLLSYCSKWDRKQLSRAINVCHVWLYVSPEGSIGRMLVSSVTSVTSWFWEAICRVDTTICVSASWWLIHGNHSKGICKGVNWSVFCGFARKALGWDVLPIASVNSTFSW